MTFRWRDDDDPLIVVFGSSHPSSTSEKNYNKKKQKKNVVKVGPPLTKFSGSAHEGRDEDRVNDQIFWAHPFYVLYLEQCREIVKRKVIFSVKHT